MHHVESFLPACKDVVAPSHLEQPSVWHVNPGVLTWVKVVVREEVLELIEHNCVFC